MVFRAVVFTFIPTIVELVLVCGLLARTFRPLVSIMVVATFVAYVAWTLYMTAVRLQIPFLTDVAPVSCVSVVLTGPQICLAWDSAPCICHFASFLRPLA